MADVPQLASGRRIVVDVLERDEVDLTLQARFVEVAGETPAPETGGLTADEADEAEFAEE
jgi:hypothetical protein